MVLMDTYDKKADVHSFWISETIPSAKRALRSLSISNSRDGNLITQYPADFEIIHLGDFDEDQIFLPVRKTLGTYAEVISDGEA